MTRHTAITALDGELLECSLNWTLLGYYAGVMHAKF